ncbi:hypothetical protein K437DRAFT_266354 [Tilletiaria anomala UBC 951]|uniref:SPX domain-containing protein n=1 Tax=Tilletiaria anomala (strain ATCC 24038 / CBS 436.72 / UBC 951) TaxID=1037660 RepID=A0A066WFV7_TILAU|nr:uncharacterized protein K437DRAFT_266354 [Tilletiaria anomala UBC 951]KDN52686.1 hypothetical protein K437DRAFT_266354 [Tilletiaria anomala UBC 951]
MKFGKQILSQQISGWGSYYLDYKFLKKIINSLEKGRITDAALLATGMRPGPKVASEQGGRLESDGQQGEAPSEVDREAAEAVATQILIGGHHGGDGSDELKLHKAAFFFKLERELEKASFQFMFSKKRQPSNVP